MTKRVKKVCEQVEHGLELKLRSAQAQAKILKSKLERSEKHNLILEDTFAKYAQLSTNEKICLRPVKPRLNKSKQSGIAVIHWTDWHVAEVVTKSRTNGLNKFNPEVCKSRVDKLIDSSVHLTRLHRTDFQIDEIVLILGGDFITGYLHPELEQTNAMGPVEECYFALDLLANAVASFYEAVKPIKLRVVCHRGNHGRSTPKMQFKNDDMTSFESLVYWVLRDRLSYEPKIEFVINQGSITYTELTKGTFIRSAHGHQIRFGGGIGGLLVPGNRWVLKQNETKKSVMTFIGHFHQYNRMRGLLVSGSLKGWDEYAQEFGFPFEPPSQSFELFDCQRKCFVTSSPIFCE